MLIGILVFVPANEKYTRPLLRNTVVLGIY